MIRVDAIKRVRVHPILELPAPESKAALASTLAVSSIAPAASMEQSERTLRPRLDPPLPHYMWDIIKFYSEMEKIAAFEGQICDKETKRSLDHLLAIDKQKLEMLQSRIEEIRSRQSWTVFETVAQYISSTSSIAIGLAVSGTVPVAGAFLIAAGGLGLVNRAVSDTGGWHWLASHLAASSELQQKIATQIDSYTVYVSTALAIAGSIGAYYAGALSMFSNRNTALEKIMLMISYSASALQLTSRYGMARIDKKLMNISAELKNRNTDSFCCRQEIQTNTANIRKVIDLSEKIAECIKRAIASSPT